MQLRTKFAFALVLPLVALMGCEKSPRDKLQGEWDGVSIDNCPPGEVAHATSWVKGTAFTFTGNKVKVTIPAESPQSGSWKIAKADPTGMTLTFLREDGTSYGEAELKMVGERELRWNIGNGREVVMQKKM